MKKMLSILLAVVMLVGGSITVSYAETYEFTDSMEYKVLKGLGMLPDDWTDEFNPDATLTRGDFFEILSEILYPGKAATQEEAVAVLATSGIVDNPEDPDISTKVTYVQAVKMAAVAAGYKQMAVVYGGWPEGFISAASQAEITDGVKGGYDKAITAENVVKLLYNMLHAKVLEKNLYSVDGDYEISENTVLEKYRGIYCDEGLMTSNGVTELDEPEYYMPREVIIGGISYEKETDEFDTLIGCQTDVYYTVEMGGDRKLVFVVGKTNKNTSLVINAEQIETVSERVDLIEYYKDEELSKLAKIKLSPSMSVIFNGKAVSGYTKDDFTFDCGEIIFIDNNGDEKYDVASITCYENMLVKGVNLNEKIIYNGFDYEGAIAELEADAECTDYIIEIVQDGTEVGIEDVSVGSILSVAKSKSEGHNVIRVLLNDERIQSTLSQHDSSEKEVTIDGKVYGVSESYYKLNEKNSVWGAVLKAGNNYEFAFDAFGNVAGAKLKATDGEFYAFLFKVYFDDVEELVYIKYLSYDGGWYKKELAEKVRLNGEKVYASICCAELGVAENTSRQLVRIKESSDGKITDIRTAIETDVPNETKFIKGTMKNNKWFSGNRSMQGIVYAENDAVWFNIPVESASKEVKDNPDNYFITKPSERWYDYVAYDMDEFFCAKAFVLHSQATGNQGDYILVEGVEDVINSDEEPVTRIRGQYGSYDEVAFNAADDKVLKDVQKGDFIRLYFNGNGVITGYDSIYKVSQGNSYSPQTSQSNWGAASQWDTGRFEAADLEKKFMKISVVGGKEYSLRLGSTPKLYDVKTNQFRSIDYSELKQGDFLVFNMSYYSVGRVIAYRF